MTPHFMAALATVAATNMITTISEAFARRFADAFDLIVREPPFADTELRVTLVWSHIHATDPLLAWFRGLVRDVARQVYENNGRLDT
jgi:DNA-binding transcriptional LysR family regulator